MRAALLALLLLAPVPTAVAPCTVGGVCYAETKFGSSDCEGLGGGSTNASYRNVQLGFPVTASARGDRSCSAISRTDTVTTNVTAGQYAAVGTHWSSTSSTGWRYVRVNATTAADDARLTWYGDDDRCRVEALVVSSGSRLSDQRDCPASVRPPPAPPLPWGDLLP